MPVNSMSKSPRISGSSSSSFPPSLLPRACRRQGHAVPKQNVGRPGQTHNPRHQQQWPWRSPVAVGRHGHASKGGPRLAWKRAEHDLAVPAAVGAAPGRVRRDPAGRPIPEAQGIPLHSPRVRNCHFTCTLSFSLSLAVSLSRFLSLPLSPSLPVQHAPSLGPSLSSPSPALPFSCPRHLVSDFGANAALGSPPPALPIPHPADSCSRLHAIR